MSIPITTLKGSERITTLKHYARELMEEDGGQLILQFNGHVAPEKIVKFLDWVQGEYRVKVAVTHAELKEYVTMAIAGGAVGCGLAVLAKYFGFAVSWPIALAFVAGGAIMGALSTTLNIRIYKYKGNTRIKLVAA